MMHLLIHIFKWVTFVSFWALIKITWSCVGEQIEGRSFLTDQVIEIDGVKEQVWNNAMRYNAAHEVCGPEWDGSKDFSVHWKSLWDENNIYFFFEVVDDKLVKNHNAIVPFWENDMIELIFTKKRRCKEPQNSHFSICFDVDSIIMPSKGSLKSPGARHILIVTDDGYNVEMSIPWDEIGIDPLHTKSIYFNIEASDCDGESSEEGIFYGREAVISWSPNTCGKSVSATNNFGTLLLVE